ncbi:unnamed protein product, partial [Owenia fusiformis]
IKEEHNYADERSTDFHDDQPEENPNQSFQQTSKEITSMVNYMDSSKQLFVKEVHSAVNKTLPSKKQSVNVKSSAINNSDDNRKTAELKTNNVPKKIKKRPNPEKSIFIPPELLNTNHPLIFASTKDTDERMETTPQSQDLLSQSKREEQYGIVDYVQGDVVTEDAELMSPSEQYQLPLNESLLQIILMNGGDDNDSGDLHIKDDGTLTQMDSISRDTNMDEDNRDIHADNDDVKPNLELLSDAQSQANSKAPDKGNKKLHRVYCFGQNTFTPVGKVPDERPGQTMQDSKTLCNLCNKNFRTNQIFRKHKQTYKHFKCDICTYSFMDEIDLMMHLITLHKIKIQCGFCNKEYKSLVGMRNHLKSSLHFKCTLCPKSFETNKQLTSHSKIHSLKPYTCNQCSQLFTCEEDLNIHFNSTHKCKQCFEVFTSRQDLKTHVQFSHVGSQNTCRYCPKNFPSKNDLNTHLHHVHDETLFKCDVEFTQKAISYG